jgi:eukaryotic-like serine/threonine-protein kinase
MTDPTDQTETLPGADVGAGTPADDGRPPRILGDRYRLDELIASGGMASVWRAHDAVLARSVAVKMLHDHLAVDDDFRERFRREAISAAKLSHPNVVGVYDTGAEGNRVYLVMEFVAGSTLKDVITDLGRIPPAQAASIGQRIAGALDFAHSRGLVHRDVKPANILVGEDGEVKVADFGIAKLEESGDDLTRTGMVLGTAAYVAPEQILGERLDGKADQYALGCMLYEALTGRQPFKGDSAVGTAALRLETDPTPIRQLAPEVPPALEAAVHRAMARRPDDRFPTSGQLAAALAPFAGDDNEHTALLEAATPDVAPAPALAPGPTPRRAMARAQESQPPPAPPRSRRSNPLVPMFVILGLAAALVGFGVLSGAVGDRSDPPAAEGDEGEEAGSAPLEPAEVVLFDPGGTGSEDGDGLPALFDGDPSTGWRSVGYNTPAFGNLKPGLGFYVDLGDAHALERVALRTSTPGVSLELRVADEPAEDADGWELVETVSGAQELTEVEFDVTTRYLLVWVTGDLQPDGGRHRVGFTEMTIEGGAA